MLGNSALIRSALAAVVTLLVLGGCAGTEGAPQDGVAPAPLPEAAGDLAEAAAAAGHAVDPEAAAILGRAGALLREARSFTYHARLSWSETGPLGVKLRWGGTLDGAVRRPDRFHVDHVTDRNSTSLWFDGRELSLYSEDHGVFSRLEVPGESDAALRHARDRHAAVVPLTSLLLSDPVEDMRERLAFGYVVGEAWVDGQRCHHLLFLEDELHWQAWIDAGERPLPRQIAITYIDQPGQPEFLATLSNWRFGIDLPDARFEPRIPDAANEVEWVVDEVPRGP